MKSDICSFPLCLNTRKHNSLCARHYIRLNLSAKCTRTETCLRQKISGSLYCKHHRLRRCSKVKHTLLTRNKTDEKRRKLTIILKIEKGPCVDCGENNVQVMEFDHLHNKIRAVSQMSSIQMRSEANKCVMRCRRCHHIKTAQSHQNRNTFNNKYRIRNKNYVDAVKNDIGGCVLCGWFQDGLGLSALEFDHLIHSQKFSSISEMVRSPSSIENIQKEIDKCQLLCSNCHHIKTNKERCITLYKDYEHLILAQQPASHYQNQQ
jgi:5-methylcytosine-specific restriction endonuclease McrA